MKGVLHVQCHTVRVSDSPPAAAHRHKETVEGDRDTVGAAHAVERRAEGGAHTVLGSLTGGAFVEDVTLNRAVCRLPGRRRRRRRRRLMPQCRQHGYSGVRQPERPRKGRGRGQVRGVALTTTRCPHSPVPVAGAPRRQSCTGRGSAV